MNLKEYNYCKRHHPYALAHVLELPILNQEIDILDDEYLDVYGYDVIHDANNFWDYNPKIYKYKCEGLSQYICTFYL